MQVVVKGKNIEVTEALRSHAEAKVSKVDKLGLGFKEIEVKLVVERNPRIKKNQIAELTLTGNGPLIRAAERDNDMYVAIDKAVLKLLRQIKKFHGKRIDRTQSHVSALRGKPVTIQEGEPGYPKIVRKKSIALKPMSPEEAALQMEMLGHDFFIFADEATDRINVVYKRKNGEYGLIETSR